MEFPPYRLDLRAGRLWRNDQAMALRPKAWALLCYLAERPGILVTKDELHAAVWGDIVVSDDTLTRTLESLRHGTMPLARRSDIALRPEHAIIGKVPGYVNALPAPDA